MKPDWSQIHNHDIGGFLGILLAFFSILYGIAIKLRQKAYKLKLLKPKTLPGFVVSVGNLTVGGTGKTPAVIMLAKWASKKGYHVAVLSRGYGGKYRAKVLEVSNMHYIKATPEESGDEPYLIAAKLPGIPVIIAKKRYLAGLWAYEKYNSNFFIVDDGFQHQALARNLNLVLIDTRNPFGNNCLLPKGPLREPLKQLGRADQFILTRLKGHKSESHLATFLKKKFPNTPVFFATHLPDQVIFPNLNKSYPPEFLNGKRVIAFAGIGQPDSFKETLTDLGANVVYFMGFKDHALLKQKEIRNLIRKKEILKAQYIITTEKDWTRMKVFFAGKPDFGYLVIRFVLKTGQEIFFDEFPLPPQDHNW